MPQTAAIPPRAGYSAIDWVFLVLLSLVGLGVGLAGILHYGYIGQDFATHRGLILAYPSGFTYALTNPPGLYWFASGIRDYVSRDHYPEFTALAFLALNTAALWIIYGFIWGSIARRELRYCAAAFITLVPFRVIHSVVIAADAFTLPIFALVALFTYRLFENPRALGSWAWVSLSLLAGSLCKYSFAGLMPPVALLLGVAVCRRLEGAGRLRWGLVGALALAIPSGEFLHEIHESAALGGEVTSRQWLPKGAPSVMRWRDILLLRPSDVGVLQAPGYFRDKLFERRKFSYLALLHVSSVTDVFDFFQRPPAAISTEWNTRTQDEFARERTRASQTLQTWSVRWCLVYSALAVTGTFLCCVLAGCSLAFRKPWLPDSAVVVTALAAGFYSVILFSLPRLGDPYTPGFWLPRLVLPALVIFYMLGFVALDLAMWRIGLLRKASRTLLALFAGYTLVACLLFAGFLS
jgi:hypothetical protein